MMNTILNLGLNDTTTAGLAAKSGNERFAYDCYRRFMQLFGEVALDVPMEKFDHIFDSRKAKVKAKLDTALKAEDLKAIIAEYKKLVHKETGKPFPEDPHEQLASRDAVFRSWWTPKAAYYRKMEKISDDIGTAANVQAMVFGNMGDTSGTGVGFTRDPGSGEKVFYGEFLMNAQGEDVVAGIRTPHPIADLEKILPEAYAQLRAITTSLENHYKDMQDFEFTIQEGKLYMLQTRNGKRTGPAAVRIAVAMVEEGMIPKQEAVMRVAPSQLDQLLHPVFDTKTLKDLVKLTTGISASPGAAVGRVAFTAEDAVEMAPTGPVLLVRKETTPDDIHGMDVARGILTAIGGKSEPCGRGRARYGASLHCRRQWNPYRRSEEGFHGAGGWQNSDRERRRFHFRLDGTTGDVYVGHAKSIEPNLSHDYIGTFMGWTDEFRGKFGIRANADIPRDAKVARQFGAEGIGLCRTEHMFFAEDRLPFVQAMILASDEKSRRKALLKLLPMQRSDFAGLFKAMDGFPVVIRTLDPPLHEFLPKRENLMVDVALLPYADIKAKKEFSERYKIAVKDLKKDLPLLLRRVEDLHEFNPMLGHRGCRLGVTYPEITEMQSRAIFEAAVQVEKKGVKVLPEIMIPLIGSVEEFNHQKKIVDRVAAEVFEKAGHAVEYMVGTMIEIPRAALTADKIAKEAEFFSFGTNDLTQTAMGLSRDDYTRFQKDYETAKIFKADPFAVLDQEGVGKLVEMATKLGRSVRKDLVVGICGEHGCEPSSVQFCYKVGMDYSFRARLTVCRSRRLAAAQAAISGGKAVASRTA